MDTASHPLPQVLRSPRGKAQARLYDRATERLMEQKDKHTERILLPPVPVTAAMAEARECLEEYAGRMNKVLGPNMKWPSSIIAQVRAASGPGLRVALICFCLVAFCMV